MIKIYSIIYLLIAVFSPFAWSEDNNDEVKEKKYVTDKLRLSLYKNADSNSGTLKLLISGDVLNVLERQGPYSKVSTDQGLVGWVKNGFLVSIPTASFLLIEEQNKNLKLTQQLEKFSNTQKIIDDYETTIQKMNSENELTVEELNKTKQSLKKISEDSMELQEELDIYLNNSDHLSWKEIVNMLKQSWYVVALVSLLIFLAGFVGGKELVQSQIRKRFQGVKVL